MRIDIQNTVIMVLCLCLMLITFSPSVSASSLEITFPQVPTSWTTVCSVMGTDNQLYTIDIRLVSSDAPVYFYIRPVPVSTVHGYLAATIFSTTANYIVETRTNAYTHDDERPVPSVNGPEYGIYSSASWGFDTSDTAKYDFSTVNTYGFPYYSSHQAGISDAVDFLKTTVTFSLPAGNIAFVQLQDDIGVNGADITLHTEFPVSFGTNDYGRVNQTLTYSSSLPSTSNNSVPNNGYITWLNDGKVNLFGISTKKVFESNVPGPVGGQYVVICNPLYMNQPGGSIGGEYYYNGSIDVSITNAKNVFYIYPLTDTMTIDYGNGISSVSSYGSESYVGTYNEEDGVVSWEDPNGGNNTPVTGGDNELPEPTTIFDLLRNIGKQISDFLSGPISAIKTVVNAIQNFLSSFVQLYIWLPEPVYKLITSALMIALTIGVIKIFV